MEKTLDTTGNVVNSRALGNVSSLKVLSETNTGGQTVRRVQDTTGAVIELVLDTAGKVVSSKVLSRGTTPNQ